MTSDIYGTKESREIERLLALANVQRLREQYVEAEDTCREALKIDPNDIMVKEMLADLLHERGKLEDALAEYKSAMELVPGKVSLETKYAKLVIEIAEHNRERALAEDMLNNPHKYTKRKKNPGIAFIMAAIVPGLGQFYNSEYIKAGILFGVFILFVAVWAAVQNAYTGVVNIGDFFTMTSPAALILGFLAIISYLYGIFDAVLVASRSILDEKSKTKQ